MFETWNEYANDPSASLNPLSPFLRGIYKTIHILKDVKFTLSNRKTTFNFKYPWKFQRKLFKERLLQHQAVTIMDSQFVICLYCCNCYIDSTEVQQDIDSWSIWPNKAMAATFHTRMIFVDA
jgi:hypothetical protein